MKTREEKNSIRRLWWANKTPEEKRAFKKRWKKGDKKACDLRYHDKSEFGGNRIKALKRDDYKCTKCGTNRSRLIVHHKDGAGRNSIIKNNKMSNLQTVCQSCHIYIHKELRNGAGYKKKGSKCQKDIQEQK